VRTMAITTKSVLVEAYWSVRLIERVYPILQCAYDIILEELKGSGLNKDIVLQIAVKAVNDLASLDRLVLTLLVFGAYLRLSKLDPLALLVTQRATAIKKAISEVTKLRAKI
jgi:hypothetical protein